MSGHNGHGLYGLKHGKGLRHNRALPVLFSTKKVHLLIEFDGWNG